MTAAPDFHPGHLVMVDIHGTTLTAETARFLREHHIRAVCLFRKNLGSETEVRQLTRDLREVLGPRALIGIDQEGGSVARITFFPQAPAPMALGALGRDDAAEQAGAAVARGLRDLGINWNFAPVLDVNNNPANPVIGERSFGADPELVARLSAAWMRGSLAEGVACCVKHFPGHGDTHVDSHHALPTVDKSLAELEAMELLPFRRLAAEAPSVMTAHIVYPQLDPDYPATLSRRILTGVLRETMGYDGVVITDALMMKAIHERFGHPRAAVLALQAGADMPLAQGTLAEQAAAVVAIGEALADGRLDRAAALRSAQRLDHLATSYPADWFPYPEEQRLADEALMAGLWAKSLTALRGARAPAVGTPLRVVTQHAVPSDGVAEAGPSAEDVRRLFDGHADIDWVEVDDLARFDPAALPRDARTLVLVSNHRHRYGERGTAWHPALHLALWNPFQVMDIAAPSVVSWGYANGALAALRAWLDGAGAAEGVSPVDLGA